MTATSKIVRRCLSPALAVAAILCAVAAAADSVLPPAPEPPEVPEGIAAELASLQAQIDELIA
jgi:hypothetical protein